ncbi:hypothetical protein [Paraburkholderia sp. BCC1886]|uniref:hypothetical protein n=1 Tax=Paraburkholderia sp. BCC1886 TaxID=2562670 RepID=UPI001182004F|nr:hypothetical protein [Paraburkholderia sp. BCC1886]
MADAPPSYDEFNRRFEKLKFKSQVALRIPAKPRRVNSAALANAKAELAFLKHIVAAIQDAGAARQKITHQTHCLSDDELRMIQDLQTKIPGAEAKIRRIQVIGR